jgi:hypothetical protein
LEANGMTEVVKVQKAVFPSDGICLLYGKDRSNLTMADFDTLPHWLQNVLNEYPKAYCEGDFENDTWKLHRLAKTPDW